MLNKIKQYRTDITATGSGTSIGLGKRNKEANGASPPSDQAIKHNAGDTETYISDNDVVAQDWSTVILEITPSSILTISVDDDNYEKFKVTSVTDNTGSFTIVRTLLKRVGTISGEVSVEIDLVNSEVNNLTYTPEDSDNEAGFFAGLLTNGKLTTKSALDEIVRRIKIIENPPADNLPSLSSITIEGYEVVGGTVEASYVYSDADGDPESGTTFQWYRADDAMGAGEAVIAGATTINYIFQVADGNKFVRIGITPANANGTGSEYFGEYTAAIKVLGEQPGSAFEGGTISAIENFETDKGAFTLGMQIAQEGNDLNFGFLRIATNQTTELSFGAIATGKVLVEFALRFEDSETASGSDSSKNIFIYVLPTGAATSSANAGAFLTLRRGTSLGGTATHVGVYYRTGTVDTLLFSQARYSWHHYALLLDVDNKTFDIFYEGQMFVRGAIPDNTTYTDINRLVILNNTSAPILELDSVKVTHNPSVYDFNVLRVEDNFVGTGEIGGSDITTDNMNLFPQKWFKPSNPLLSTMTRTANGAIAGANPSSIFARGGSQGVWEMTFKEADSGATYVGLIMAMWGGVGLGSTESILFYNYRYRSDAGAGQKLVLSRENPDVPTTVQASDGTGITWGAGLEHTLKVVRNGNYLFLYVDDVLQFDSFSDPYTSYDYSLLGEENFGAYIDPSLGGGSIVSITHSGLKPRISTEFLHGNIVSVSCQTTVLELYVAGSEENIFWGKGIQLCHISGTEPMMGYATHKKDILNVNNVIIERMRGLSMAHQRGKGFAECWITRTRRGVFADENIIKFDSYGNFGSDIDLRPEIFEARNARGYYGTTGVVVNDLSIFHQITTHATDFLPMAWQVIGHTSDGRYFRMTISYVNIDGMSTNDIVLNSRYPGDGSPLSVQVRKITPAPFTNLRMIVSVVIEVGDNTITFDDEVGHGIKKYIDSPVIPTFSTGTIKTDATGDSDNDGFNNQYGWLEVNGPVFDLSLTISHKFPQFQIRVHGWTGANTVLVNDVEDTGAMIDDLGGSTALITLSETITGLTTIELS